MVNNNNFNDAVLVPYYTCSIDFKKRQYITNSKEGGMKNP